MIRQLVSFIFCVAALFCAGCVSVDAHFPIARMESPETNGRDRITRLATGLTQMHELRVTDEAGKRPLDLDKAYLTSRTTVMFFGTFAVRDNLDLGVHTTLGKAPVMATAKWQLLGTPAAHAEQGNASLAVTGALGYWEERASGSQQELGGDGDFPWNLSLTSRTYDTGLIGGYRITDRDLIYGGVFYTYYDVNVLLVHKRSGDGTSQAHTYDLEYDGHQTGFNLGVAADMSELTQLMVEVTYATIQLGNLKNSVLSGGVNIAFQF